MITFVAEREVSLKSLSIDGGTQSRCKINTDIVTQYAENMENGDVFPAVVAIFDGKNYWLADGFHRYHAVMKNNGNKILCKIANGTLRDAILYSYQANHAHGLQMTNEDKRHVVMEMLNDFEWKSWGERAIANHCGVSHVFVSALVHKHKIERPEEIKYIRNGKELTKKRKPVIKPAPLLKEPIKTEEPVEEKFDEKQEAIQFLIEENDKLKLQLASMSGEESEFTKELIQDLQAEVKQKTVELAAVTKSRDLYQAQCSEMKKQITYLTKQLKK